MPKTLTEWIKICGEDDKEILFSQSEVDELKKNWTIDALEKGNITFININRLEQLKKELKKSICEYYMIQPEDSFDSETVNRVVDKVFSAHDKEVSNAENN